MEQKEKKYSKKYLNNPKNFPLFIELLLEDQERICGKRDLARFVKSPTGVLIFSNTNNNDLYKELLSKTRRGRFYNYLVNLPPATIKLYNNRSIKNVSRSIWR